MTIATLERITRARPKSFLEREFPNGLAAKPVTITPQIAQELLANNADNRRIVKAKKKQYASDMKAGRWQLNGETIIIADDGNINTGQNRLEACIEADMPFDTFVVFGVARDTRYTVDTGKPQGCGDKLSMLGVPNANPVAAIAKMAIAYARSGGRTIRADIEYVSQTEAFAYVEKHEDALQEAFRFAHANPKSYQGLVSQSVMGLAAYILSGDVARQYLKQVMTGENIGQTDPAYRVRERLRTMGRGNRPGRLEAILRGWVYFRDGKPMTMVKLTGELPKI